MFWILTPSWPYRLQIFYSIQQVTFSCCRWFSFAEHKLLHLMKSPLFLLYLFGLTRQIKKILLLFMSQNVRPMFSWRSFKVSGLTFRCLIHFEFIIVYGVRKYSSFILLQVVDQFSQHHLLKRLSFFHCIVLPPLSKIRCP